VDPDKSLNINRTTKTNKFSSNNFLKKFKGLTWSACL